MIIKIQYVHSFLNICPAMQLLAAETIGFSKLRFAITAI